MWPGAKVMKLLIMYFSAPSCYFIYLRSKSSPQHPVMKHLSLRSFLTLRYQVCTQTTGKIIVFVDRAVAQVVSRWLPTSAAHVWAQVRSCAICGERNDTGASLLRELRFPLPILIPPTALRLSSSIIRGWYNKPIRSRRSKWTQSNPTPRNLKKNSLCISIFTFLNIRKEGKRSWIEW
jgi:hypothetical protein